MTSSTAGLSEQRQALLKHNCGIRQNAPSLLGVEGPAKVLTFTPSRNPGTLLERHGVYRQEEGSR